MSNLTRRQFGKLSAAALLAPGLAALPSVSLASNPTGRRLHGLSAFGELALPADYPNFPWVNVDAPKGGVFNFSVSNWAFNQNPQSFDTLNTFVLKGSAPPRIESCFDTLMTPDADDPSAIYCALASDVEISDDRNTYTFSLRPEARWHDGSPVSAEDVAYTYNTFKKDGHPDLALNLIELVEAKVLADGRVSLIYSGKQSDRLILANAVLPIVSKAFFEANDFLTTTMTPPLGSGPYKVGRLRAGSFIEYDRVDDYWAKDMPFAKGQANFDTLRVEFYRERQAAFEAFKKGNIHYREEFTSKTWATEYNFPAVSEGRVKQQLFDAEKSPSMQGWACNTRREKLADPRTREAIGLCFDFEWTNANFFYGIYERNSSFFQKSDFAASGPASPEERELLEPYKDQLDPSVFEAAYVPPVSDGSGRDRTLLRRANDLLLAAGWTRQGSNMVDASGNKLAVEFLIRSPTFERILARFVENLRRLGVDASIRLVDPSQFQKRLETFDFDIVGLARNVGATPTAEGLAQLFGSNAATIPGSPNTAGISSPVVDGLVAKVNDVQSREELTVILRALDRVLRSTHSWIPNWHSTNHRVAYWDMFGFPEAKPQYAFPVEATWWFDAEKAKAIGKG
ncbi:extracellular solute-binding protein [Pseudahrensia aquimaris]|uniref:Extracellular solute-binding protein n=1 Tax=Pseudahrensia aquimaris TaxID=744461 RepID=A0ABW3FHU9_9HYPH